MSTTRDDSRNARLVDQGSDTSTQGYQQMLDANFEDDIVMVESSDQQRQEDKGESPCLNEDHRDERMDVSNEEERTGAQLELGEAPATPVQGTDRLKRGVSEDSDNSDSAVQSNKKKRLARVEGAELSPFSLQTPVQQQNVILQPRSAVVETLFHQGTLRGTTHPLADVARPDVQVPVVLRTPNSQQHRSPVARGRQSAPAFTVIDWRSNADRNEIRALIEAFLYERESQGMDGPRWVENVAHAARQLESGLFRSARSFDEYNDRSTFEPRVQRLALELEFIARREEGEEGGARYAQQPPVSNEDKVAVQQKRFSGVITAFWKLYKKVSTTPVTTIIVACTCLVFFLFVLLSLTSKGKVDIPQGDVSVIYEHKDILSLVAPEGDYAPVASSLPEYRLSSAPSLSREYGTDPSRAALRRSADYHVERGFVCMSSNEVPGASMCFSSDRLGEGRVNTNRCFWCDENAHHVVAILA